METYNSDKSVYLTGKWTFSGGRWDGTDVSYEVHQETGKLTRTLSGFKNPHWKEQVLNLENATTPATGYYLSLEYTPGDHWVIWKDNQGVNQKFTMWGCYPAWYLVHDLKLGGQDLWPGTIGSAAAANRAVISFRKKLRAAQVAFSAPTFLGELGESIHMIRHPAKGLNDLARSYLDRVKDAKKKRPRNWKKNLAGLWLEQAFGWQPLINDINNAFAAYKSLIPDRVQFVSGFGKDEALRTKDYFRTSDGRGFIFFYVSRIQIETVIVKLRGCVKRMVSAPVKDKLEHFGFTPSEFLPTAWELLPWSFLIDYFTNIGDIIQANVTSTSEVAWVDRSDISSKKYTIGENPALAYEKTLQGYKGNGGNGSTATLVSRKWSRTPNVGLPLGSLEFSIPGIWAPWANMLALFTQANSTIHPQRPWPKFR